MFRCDITGKLSHRGDPRIGAFYHLDEKSSEDTHSSEKVHRIVVETREKVYKRRVFNETTRQPEEIEVGRGREIVREVVATQEGFDLWNSWSPNDQAAWVQARFGGK